MNMEKIRKIIVILGAGAFALWAWESSGQDTAAAPQLSYGVAQVMKLEQAKVGDGTIIAYISNSGNTYPLDANQIIYLRQQGVSDTVLTTMLAQPKAYAASANLSAPTPATPPPPAADPAPVAGTPPVAVATAAPSVTYVQTAPTVYSYPDYYPAYNYYGYYGWPHPWFPWIGLGWGWWGGGWHWGGGGWHGGVAWHGGGWGGSHGGGGWHGGGGHH